MIREELEQRMDHAARNFTPGYTIQKYEAQHWRINDRLSELRRIAVLEDALARCHAG